MAESYGGQGAGANGRVLAPPPTEMQLIERMSDLERLAGRLAGASLVAADTEAAGYHRYLDRVCLLQLSTRDETWIVDTVHLASLNPLADLFEDPAVEVVFHDADYDLRLLDRDFGVGVRGLFDTKIAARFLGRQSFGLASLLAEELGVEQEKKFQRADWARRPLSPEMIEYAATDTRHLPQLRDILRAELETAGRLAWAEEEFLLQERVRWEPPAEDSAVYQRVKGSRDLGRRELAALRELHGWREAVARERDAAAFRVLSNDVLLEMARRMPATPKGLESVPGLSAGNARRWGGALLEAVERARALPEERLPSRPAHPPRPPRDPELEARIEVLRVTRDREADRLGLERGFLMPRTQLEAVARALPRDLAELAALGEMRRWQVEALGEALIRTLSEEIEPSSGTRRAHGTGRR
jgi:ribonuclease D